MPQTTSRRDFLCAAGAFGTAAVVSGYLPADWLLAQPPPPTLDSMRAQMGSTPVQKMSLATGLTLFYGPGGNVVVLQGSGGKIVVDGFVKPAWPKLKAELDALDGSPIKSMVDTHWHFDHADNNANFRNAGAGVIAHDNTKKRLMESHDLIGIHFDPAPSAELPTQTFPSGLTLNAGAEQVRLDRVAPAHTDTDIFVRFPKADVLHMGDVYFNGFYPFIDASTGGHINGMIDGVQTALKTVNARTKIVPGHGPLGNRASLEAYGHMLTTIRDKVRTLKASGKALADVQAARPSAEFDAAWGKGRMTPDDFVALVFATVR
jgi:glyoxylase-like metal-dependent hydrolase (beta-lactamase superfamily II)